MGDPAKWLPGIAMEPSGSGSGNFYVVEARWTSHGPISVAGYQLDGRWQRLQFPKAPIGVPNSAAIALAAEHGLLNFEAAEALRWWFFAQAAAEFRHFCIDTRLVKVRLSYEFRCTELGVTEPLNAAEWMRGLSYSERTVNGENKPSAPRVSHTSEEPQES